MHTEYIYRIYIYTIHIDYIFICAPPKPKAHEIEVVTMALHYMTAHLEFLALKT